MLEWRDLRHRKRGRTHDPGRSFFLSNKPLSTHKMREVYFYDTGEHDKMQDSSCPALVPETAFPLFCAVSRILTGSSAPPSTKP